MDRRQLLLGAAATSLIAAAPRVAFGQEVARPDYYPADYGKLIEASRNENRVIVYSNSGPDVYRFLVEEFKKAYPWIAVEITELGGSEGIEKYLSESAVGTQTADVIICDGAAWIDLGKRGGIAEYRTPEAAYLPDWAVNTQVPNMHIGTVTPSIFAWNKLLLAENERPKTFAGMVETVMADPDRFRGHLTTYGANLSAFGYGFHRTFIDHTGDKGWAWFDQLGPLTRGERSAGGIIEKLLSGEYVLSYFSSGNSTWNALRNNPEYNNVIGWGFIGDGSPMLARGAGVTTAGTNPNSGKLFLDFVLSRTGQLALGKTGWTLIRSDITAADNGGEMVLPDVVATIGEANVWVAPYEDAFITDYDNFIARWNKSFGI
ncbi:MAG TPA: ABC transporter substrate-binding protein [Devosia sp.]|nr:ABC transporter substrate-binding protein [Devosia sp.]